MSIMLADVPDAINPLNIIARQMRLTAAVLLQPTYPEATRQTAAPFMAAKKTDVWWLSGEVRKLTQQKREHLKPTLLR